MVPSLVNKGILLSKLPLHRQMNILNIFNPWVRLQTVPTGVVVACSARPAESH